MPDFIVHVKALVPVNRSIKVEAASAEQALELAGRDVQEIRSWYQKNCMFEQESILATGTDLKEVEFSTPQRIDITKETGPHVRIEYDTSYSGGDYDKVGEFFYFPASMVSMFCCPAEILDGFVEGASACNFVSMNEDELYTPDGEDWDEEYSG